MKDIIEWLIERIVWLCVGVIVVGWVLFVILDLEKAFPYY